MSKPSINIIWFKRDLRLQDHAALAQAAADGLPCLLWYCFEPSLMAAPEMDLRHWRFVHESLLDLQQQLQGYQKKIYWGHSEVIPCLANRRDGCDGSFPLCLINTNCFAYFVEEWSLQVAQRELLSTQVHELAGAKVP